ncbi:MAG: DEAD/DEAH box helicase [Epsilonproteobacteria bacterium]|nr:DEAD/DEAH box helicase [Campylobacterota bacterium]
MRFSDFNFSKEVERGLRVAGFKEPSPIQKEAIPLVLKGYDLVAQAHTGTGKTAAFGLGIIEKINRGEIERALIITPTRELAVQVSDELYYLGRFSGIRTLAVYGGVPYGRQIALINKGVDIVVATPGRLKDLFDGGKIESFTPDIVVLDEADEMLDMGFLEIVREIFNYLPTNRQTLLFSATIPKEIKELANTILYRPKFISVVNEKESNTNKDINQLYMVIEEEQRDEAIVKLLEREDFKKALIFCRMKREVDRLSTHLNGLGFESSALHGDIEQLDREKIIRDFKRGKSNILVATDVAARGLDIKDVTHVFNYHIPFDSSSYIHRIGRTGRAGKRGKAITLVSTQEFKELKKIKKEVGKELKLIWAGDKVDIEKLKEKILTTRVDRNIDTILHTFSEVEREELVKKLLSYILKREERSLKNKIGYDKGMVDKIFLNFTKDERVKKSKKRAKK